MQRYAGSCSPDEVHMLQRICDLILSELQANGRAALTDDTDLLRDVIARRVMSHFYGDDFKRDEAAQAVLISFGVGPF